MTFTRKTLADTIDALDAEIAILQDSKRDTFQAYRDELADAMDKDAVKAEVEGVKAAIKRRQAIVKKGETVITERDALVEEIFAEISATRARRATRVEIIEEFGNSRLHSSLPDHDAETGEILEPHSPPETTPPDREADHPSGEGDHATGASAASVALIPDAGMETGVPDSGLSARIGAEAAIHSPETAIEIGSGDGAVDAVGRVATTQVGTGKPEDPQDAASTDIQESTAARKEVQVQVPGGEVPSISVDAPRTPFETGMSAPAGTQAPPVDTNRMRSMDEIADSMGLPPEPDPDCRKPKGCGRFSHMGLCLSCRVAAGLEMEGAA